MAMQKLVDGDFLNKLLAGSYEVALGAVEEAVASDPKLFGAVDETKVKVVGTYSDHAIVLNAQGEFFRCEWSHDGDEVALSNIRQINVPVIEAEVSQSTIRRQYESAVDDLLECRKEEAEEKLRELLDLVNGGVPMTAEAVENLFLENQERFESADWRQMIVEREADLRRFLGAEMLRLTHPKPVFASITGAAIDESVAEGRRAQVIEAFKALQEFLGRLRGQTVLAKQIDEGYSVRGSAEDSGSTTDFVQFVSGFTEDLDGMISVVDDAMAVAEDGCAKCLARLHDGIATQMREWAIAGAFAEKMARRFEQKAA